jgi:apolipoprotein N-acyltransferase
MLATALFTATDTTDDLTPGEVFAAWLGWITLATVIYAVIALVAAILIARKAGYSHWLGVIAVTVPIAGAIFILIFAFIKWPALKERDAALELLKKNGLSIAPAKKPDAPAGKASGALPTASAKDLKKPEAL